MPANSAGSKLLKEPPKPPTPPPYTCKVAFWIPTIKNDSYTNAIFDYAHYNQTILHNDSVILYKKRNTENDQEIIRKFRDHFPPSKIHGVNHWLEVDPFLVKSGVDVLYRMTSGSNDREISSYKKNIVHCTDHIYHPHGDVYAAISPNVDGYSTRDKLVPHPDFTGNQEDPVNMMQQFKAVFLDPIIPI